MSKEQNKNDVTLDDKNLDDAVDNAFEQVKADDNDSNNAHQSEPGNKNRRSKRKNNRRHNDNEAQPSEKRDEESLNKDASDIPNPQNAEKEAVKPHQKDANQPEKAASKVEDKKVEAKESTYDAPKKQGQSLTYLALLIALGGIGLGGFAYYKGVIEQEDRLTVMTQTVESDKATINALKSEISALEANLKSLQETTEKATETESGSLQDQVSLVAQKHETLNQALSDSAKNLQTQIDGLKKMQQSLIEKSDSIDKIATVSNQAITIANNFDKKLAEQELAQSVVLNEAKELISTIKNITDLEMLRTTEVDYLLKVAIQKVQFDKDYQIAGSLLSSALDRLNQINSINFSETKRLLTENIEALKSLKSVDLITVSNRLDKVAALIQQAPLKDDSALLNLKNEIFNQGTPEGESWSEKLTSSLKHLIVIENKRTEVPELMAKEDRFFLGQNIQLELSAAKVAILQDQYAIFEKSLQTVQSWIKTYYDEDNADVREAIQQIQWLLDAPLQVTPPNIERTFTDFEATLRAYKGA